MWLLCAVYVVHVPETHDDLQPHERSRAARARRIVLVVLSVGMVLSFAVMAVNMTPSWTKQMELVAEMASVILVTSAAVLHIYGRQRAFEEHARQYARMALLFQQADRAMEAALASADLDAARAIILDVGCEALAENADWLMLHRERPIEAPTMTPH
jgi:hypothetical protein